MVDRAGPRWVFVSIGCFVFVCVFTLREIVDGVRAGFAGPPPPLVPKTFLSGLDKEMCEWFAVCLAAFVIGDVLGYRAFKSSGFSFVAAVCGFVLNLLGTGALLWWFAVLAR